MGISTLTSLGILKVNIDEKNADYVDNLANFVLHVLNKHRPDPVTEEETSRLLSEDFGLNVPRKGAQMVLRRLSKRGVLIKEHGIFFLTDRLPAVDLSEKVREIQSHIEDVCKAIIKYASTGYALTWDEKKAIDAILAFFERFGVDYLRAYIFRTALPAIPKTDKVEHFITASFIRHHYDERSDLFESIILLLKGHMLANALVCPDLESIQKNFRRVTFYFDTPLILSLFGLQGKEEREAVFELIALLRNLHGSLAIFEHTLDEARGVLAAAEKNLENPHAEGAVIREIRKAGRKKTDLIILRENFEERLKENNITVKETPKYEEKYQIGELDLRNSLQQKIHYRNERALDHDVNSIRSIYVLRRGVVPRRLEDCIAVFLTSNSALASATFEIGQNHNSSKEVSAAITDYSLANVAWLKAPLGAPDLPKKELLASCYAAMEPDNTLWSKYVDEIEKLKNSGTISSDDHALLRVSPLATKELMNLTLGSDTSMTATTIKDVLFRVKTELTKEKDEELEIQRLKEKEIARHRDELIEIDSKRSARLYWVSERIAEYATYFVQLASFLILLLAAFSSPLLTTSYAAQSITLTRLLNGLFLFGATWGFLNWYWGISVKEVTQKLNKLIQSRTMILLKKITDPQAS